MSETEQQEELPGWGSKAFTHVIAPVLVAVILGVLGFQNAPWRDESASDGTPNPPAAAPETPPIEEVNKTVTDGSFVITVRTLQCGVKEIDSNYFGTSKPKGEFCVLRLKVENRGDTATSVSTFGWTMYVGDKRFPVDSITASGPAFGGLFPDHSAEGEVAFDVPVGNDPTKLVIEKYYRDDQNIEVPL